MSILFVCLSVCLPYLLFLRDPDAPGDADVEDPSDQTEPCSEPPEDVTVAVIRLRVIIQMLHENKRAVSLQYSDQRAQLWVQQQESIIH